MTNTTGHSIIDMTLPGMKEKVILVTLISALTLELGTSLTHRQFSTLTVAKRLGFTGRRKRQALDWALAEIVKLDPEYTIGSLTQKVLNTP